MVDKSRIIETLHSAMKDAPGDQVELVYDGEILNITHIAESEIQQNITRADASIVARVVLDGKIGVASTNKLDVDSVRACIADAADISKIAEPDESFTSLPNSPAAPEVNGFRHSTAEATPSDRANAVWMINKAAAMHNMTTAGAYRTIINQVAVTNSLGTEQYFEGTKAEFSLTVSAEDGRSGYAIAFDRDIANINPGELAEISIDKAVRSENPVDIDSGQYTVILEPAALGQLLLFLAFIGFGSGTFVQHRSFMAGSIGEQITSDLITVRDDIYNPRMQGMPFDYEGVIKKKVDLIVDGIAKGVVSDSGDARKMGTESTGHAHIATKSFTPYPKHVVMEPGDKSVKDMIGSIPRGIYITHFWYVNYLNPMRTMVTGLTRDGTFFIEEGKVTKPIVNMRMNQSILEALTNCRMLSNERRLYPQFSVVMLVPYAKIDNFQLDREGA